MELAKVANAELGWAVLDHIDANPKLWRQSLFLGNTDCGTVACYAGWAVILSGYQPVFPDPARRIFLDGIESGQVAPPGDSGDNPNNFFDVGGLAEELLGITAVEADDLFRGDNTREDLGRFVAEIFGPRPTPHQGG